mmetsp:Transcript_42055/g.121983  ORF Transcript_42055/g.121983 Transcript_42055/m.121983 type:complete len:428 (-) Transcript_42055:501-1784(-)
MFGATGSMAMVPPATPALHRSAHGRPAAFPKAVVGAATLQNVGKGDNENQDAYITSSTASGSKCFVGVFDGHGERGKHMSNFARSTMAKSLFDNQDIHSNPRGALENAYASTQAEIERLHGNEAFQSGTTAVAAYQHRDRLLVANVGDSRAVLGRCDTARQNLAAVDLSNDHKPSRPDERERVTKGGGIVDQMSFPIMHNGGIRWMRGGPERVMDRNGMGGLAMSRSLGDLALRPHVISQPEVVERKLDRRDKFLILGSDGVWDHMSSQEAVDICGRITDPTVAAKEITNIARRRWHKETDGMMSDDITAVVVRLDRGSTPSSSSGASPASTTRGLGTCPSLAGGRGNSPLSTFSPGGIRPTQGRSALQSASLERSSSGAGAFDTRRMNGFGGRGGGRQASVHNSGQFARAPELMPAAGRRSNGVAR